MRTTTFVCVMILVMAAQVAWANPAEVSQILRQTRELMESKNYTEAQKIILTGLRNNRSSYKLWLALGYVFEAEGQYEKALQAFYRARDLQFGIEGLPERIIRIQKINEQQKDSLLDKNLSLLEQAKQNIKLKRFKSGFEVFAEAVFENRNLLATENAIISEGLNYFTDKNNLIEEPDRYYFIGIYGFFAGNHDLAATNLELFIQNYPESDRIARAKKVYEEVSFLLMQLQQAIAQRQRDTKSSVRERESTSLQTTRETETPSTKTATRRPAPKDKYSGLSVNDLYSEALDLANKRPVKAIDLLSRITVRDSAQPQHFMTLGDIYSGYPGFEKEALRTYRDLMERFPHSELANEAKQKILQKNPSAEERSRQVYEHFLTQP